MDEKKPEFTFAGQKPYRSFYFGGTEEITQCTSCGIYAVIECSVHSTFPGEKMITKIGYKCLWCNWRKVT